MDQDLKVHLDKLEAELNEYFTKLRSNGDAYLTGKIKHESKYISMCRSVEEKFYESLRSVCSKIVSDIRESEIKRVTDLKELDYNKECDSMDLMLFKAIYLQDNDLLFNITYNGSKWTSKLVTKVNPKDGTTYTRYVTSIEADPQQGIGSKMDHKSSQDCSMSGADWLFFETEKPLITKNLLFAHDLNNYVDGDEIEIQLADRKKEADISEIKKYEITTEPILAFGYQIQEGFKPPVMYNFPKNIYLLKNRIDRKNSF
jgi:hypothetical protein